MEITTSNLASYKKYHDVKGNIVLSNARDFLKHAFSATLIYFIYFFFIWMTMSIYRVSATFPRIQTGRH